MISAHEAAKITQENDFTILQDELDALERAIKKVARTGMSHISQYAISDSLVSSITNLGYRCVYVGMDEEVKLYDISWG